MLIDPEQVFCYAVNELFGQYFPVSKDMGRIITKDN